MKILHFGFMEEISQGVINQLSFERVAAEMMVPGIIWDTKYFALHGEYDKNYIETIEGKSKRRKRTKLGKYLALRLHAYQWLKRNHENYDIVLMRYSIADPIQYLNSGWFENIVTVHHSLEVGEAGVAGGIKGLVKSRIERQLGRAVIGKTMGVTGVTDEITRYEVERADKAKPAYTYSNGIDLSAVGLASDKRSGCPKMVMIANFAPWHGLDRVLGTLAKSSDPFELHIVGNAPRTILSQYRNDNRLVYHGLRDKEFIENLIAYFDVGLNSFGLDRLQMNEGCTLKVREYLAAGLPVYTGVKESAFPDEFPFVKVGSPDIFQMLDYAKTCRQYGRLEVRQASSQYIEKKILMQNLVAWLLKEVL